LPTLLACVYLAVKATARLFSSSTRPDFDEKNEINDLPAGAEKDTLYGYNKGGGGGEKLSSGERV